MSINSYKKKVNVDLVENQFFCYSSICFMKSKYDSEKLPSKRIDFVSFTTEKTL